MDHSIHDTIMSLSFFLVPYDSKSKCPPKRLQSPSYLHPVRRVLEESLWNGNDLSAKHFIFMLPNKGLEVLQCLFNVKLV